MAAVWIETQPLLEEAIDTLSNVDFIAVDTESDSFHHYREKLCLIQLSGEVAGKVQDFLVDPLAKLDLKPLAALLQNEKITKIFHDVGYDLVLLRRTLEVTPAPIFDTMLALRLLGVKQFGLGGILKERFGIEANKALQRSDWSQRPLSEQQMFYASCDTHYLVALAKQLSAELEQAGRDHWFSEECLRLLKRAYPEPKSEDDRFFKLKGVKSLKGEALSLARALFVLREEYAKARDRPVFRVFSNETLIDLAKVRPLNLQALGELKGVGRSLVNALGREIVRLCEEPPAYTPPLKARRDAAANAVYQATQKRFEEWRERRRQVAASLNLDPEVLISNATLWELASQPDKPYLEHPDFSGWRREVFGAATRS